MLGELQLKFDQSITLNQEASSTYDWAECALTVSFIIDIIHSTSHKPTLPKFFNSGLPPSEIVERMGMTGESDELTFTVDSASTVEKTSCPQTWTASISAKFIRA
jgi:hypothetical protein